ncbi:hypothetical protein I5907_03020 [Panacibacter sp. DH6]|uniref:Uncharacterized protein n=1 Tax=Panacibacter microcysteis TaxID=2793269 RepID=A0A931E438_9BACT|nr:hypothetical protein [Panacibacter microcysteis]MBG9375186.1 hypothetical protein [Panacibacter microcysteis]
MISRSNITSVSLSKAGKVISSKIFISLWLIWTAFIAGSIFLLLTNNGWAILTKKRFKLSKVEAITTGQQEKNNKGAFVLVVRNKKLTLTRYTAYVDKNQGDRKNNVTTGNPNESSPSEIDTDQSNNKNIEEKESDFSVKRVPFQ